MPNDSCLFPQIEHLNTKISDDTEEHRSSLSRAESAQSQLRSEISDLKSMLEAAQKETNTLQREAMVKEAQLKAQVSLHHFRVIGVCEVESARYILNMYEQNRTYP